MQPARRRYCRRAAAVADVDAAASPPPSHHCGSDITLYAMYCGDDLRRRRSGKRSGAGFPQGGHERNVRVPLSKGAKLGGFRGKN